MYECAACESMGQTSASSDSKLKVKGGQPGVKADFGSKAQRRKQVGHDVAGDPHNTKKLKKSKNTVNMLTHENPVE